MSKKNLIVFLKFPELGKVKTRLAQKLGNKFATEFYKISTENTFTICDELQKENVSTVLFSSEKENIEKIRNWTNGRFHIKPQIGKNLGQRMWKAFEEVLNASPGKTIIIGTDLPDISKKIILKAFNYLDEFNIVLGPANDGGYYLLGMNQNHEELFETIPWSTSEVLQTTINSIEKLKLKYKLLEPLDDIDTGENLINWLENYDQNNPKNRTLYEKISDLIKQ